MKTNGGTIGILAGMGPRSTAPFVEMVITECQKQYGAKFDEEFPPMMIYSLPVPFRAEEEPDWTLLQQLICGGLKRLESCGVEFIAMPCNTAHILYDELSKCVDVTLLNMINETLSAVPPAAKNIAVLATRMTVDACIYQRGIEQSGRKVLSREGWQGRVDRLIANIKTSTDRGTSQRLWDEMVADVAADGADTILLGCTDLNAVDTRVPEGMRLLDATECLARAVVRRYAR